MSENVVLHEIVISELKNKDNNPIFPLYIHTWEAIELVNIKSRNHRGKKTILLTHHSTGNQEKILNSLRTDTKIFQQNVLSFNYHWFSSIILENHPTLLCFCPFYMVGPLSYSTTTSHPSPTPSALSPSSTWHCLNGTAVIILLYANFFSTVFMHLYFHHFTV